VVFSGASTHNLAVSSATIFNHLTLDAGALLVETVSDDNATVAGTLTNNGTIRKSQSVDATDAYTFGLTGVTITVTNRAGANPLTNLSVDRIDLNHPHGTGDAESGTNSGRYWTITPAGADYTVSLKLIHNVANDAAANVCRYEGEVSPGMHWNCVRSFSTADTVTRTGIIKLSDWAVGNNVGPTAVKLIDFTAVAAREKILPAVVTAGLAMLLVAALLLWRHKMRIQR